MAINIDEIIEVVDNRVVELNALKSVKLSSLSKNKRPAAKANKAAAQFILDRWDDDEELGRLVADEETKTTATQAWEIAKSRYEQLTQKPQVEPESKDEPTAEVADEPKEVAQNEANEDDSNAANETDSTAEVTTPEPDKKAASKA